MSKQSTNEPTSAKQTTTTLAQDAAKSRSTRQNYRRMTPEMRAKYQKEKRMNRRRVPAALQRFACRKRYQKCSVRPGP